MLNVNKSFEKPSEQNMPPADGQSNDQETGSQIEGSNDSQIKKPENSSAIEITKENLRYLREDERELLKGHRAQEFHHVARQVYHLERKPTDNLNPRERQAIAGISAEAKELRERIVKTFVSDEHKRLLKYFEPWLSAAENGRVARHLLDQRVTEALQKSFKKYIVTGDPHDGRLFSITLQTGKRSILDSKTLIKGIRINWKSEESSTGPKISTEAA